MIDWLTRINYVTYPVGVIATFVLALFAARNGKEDVSRIRVIVTSIFFPVVVLVGVGQWAVEWLKAPVKRRPRPSSGADQ